MPLKNSQLIFTCPQENYPKGNALLTKVSALWNVSPLEIQNLNWNAAEVDSFAPKQLPRKVFPKSQAGRHKKQIKLWVNKTELHPEMAKELNRPIFMVLILHTCRRKIEGTIGLFWHCSRLLPRPANKR